MAEAGRAINTAFAPPPPLWKHFTPENLQKLQRIKKEASKGEDGKPQKKDWSAKELRSLTLPPELRFLVPPEIPSEQYSVFGEVQSVRRNLLSFSFFFNCRPNNYYLAFDRSPPARRPGHHPVISVFPQTWRRWRARITA